jgi:hypothetical protein
MNYALFSTIAQGHFYYNGKTATKFFEAAFSLCHSKVLPPTSQPQKRKPDPN